MVMNDDLFPGSHWIYYVITPTINHQGAITEALTCFDYHSRGDVVMINLPNLAKLAAANLLFMSCS